MKSLFKDHINQRARIASDMAQAADAIRAAVAHANAQIFLLSTHLEELEDRFNELVAEGYAFVAGIHEMQEEFLDERSDVWREGESGKAYKEWAAEWGISLDGVLIERPEPIEEPDLSASEVLMDLPIHA